MRSFRRLHPFIDIRFDTEVQFQSSFQFSSVDKPPFYDPIPPLSLKFDSSGHNSVGLEEPWAE